MKKTAILTFLGILITFFFLDSCDQNTYNDPGRQERHKIPQESIHPLKIEKSTVANLVGKGESYLTKRLGPPDRIDPSSYGYDWYVYSSSENQYLQAGVKDSKVVTIFAAGDGVPNKPFKIGQPVTSILKRVPVKSEVTVKKSHDFFRFELSEEEMNTRPLIPFHGIYAQLYFDKFTQELSSIRYLDKETLLIQRPYSVVYRGSLKKQPSFSREKQRKIEKGQEQQILDITNVIRLQHGLEPLEWDSRAANVAFLHSKEMEDLHYFSHTSPASGDLADRLDAGKVKYTQAGENIAAKYTDGPAAVEGWLNSQGHREALLNKEYSRLGVGVYRSNFTQNFITP
ncbi:CAP domain-containing protein [Fictibacillus terranigra]|uniref:CAP domain-containing protein n=1 Tax=Fictibacillus terranigra TaxID=3058424 RepID=A0ABT8E6R2_9BACL|nr:CAP domain-containing protein [Fictibacillus sp. CENA-BCM004]MDN4073569.1 CAP domain-containing protein [Fictibacillus sp. CENA-BCM004]